MSALTSCIWPSAHADISGLKLSFSPSFLFQLTRLCGWLTCLNIIFGSYGSLKVCFCRSRCSCICIFVSVAVSAFPPTHRIDSVLSTERLKVKMEKRKSCMYIFSKNAIAYAFNEIRKLICKERTPRPLPCFSVVTFRQPQANKLVNLLFSVFIRSNVEIFAKPRKYKFVDRRLGRLDGPS